MTASGTALPTVTVTVTVTARSKAVEVLLLNLSYLSLSHRLSHLTGGGLGGGVEAALGSGGQGAGWRKVLGGSRTCEERSD